MSCLIIVCFASILTVNSVVEASRILAYYPTPSVSHQVVFRPLSLELAKRGHEVIVITPDPMFPNGTAPENLTEIDVHDLSYRTWRKLFEEHKNKMEISQFGTMLKSLISIMEEQIKTEPVQKILKDPRPFDLIIVEAHAECALGLTHIYKAPVIQFSSLAGIKIDLQLFGAATHPLLYPTFFHHRIYNLTLREKLNELYDEYVFDSLVPEVNEFCLDVMKRVFSPDVPTVEELRKNVDMIFLNVHPLWDFNRPVPPNVVYLGGMHQKPAKDLPKDLQNYLDSSKNGVIYVSFGTNVDPALFPPEKIQTLVNVFSKLPYDILWKWNQDELPGRTPNIRISKWFPQSDLLRHPKIKLFVTQCGLQSTDEAITAGVPLLGMPVFADQEFNVEQYLHYGIGVRVDLETVTEDKLNEGINKILKDDSYRNNIVRLRTIMRDQPQTPLERAVWWTEYTIRHSGARHLRTPAANISLAEYYELELVITVLFVVGLVLGVVIGVLRYIYVKLFRVTLKVKKN
ncbi:UDP-glycosyltransferase UGT5-like [Ostrinia nubilalis]|uniref:UDP-glycosyltransferase UGT5-like n=1 Tax=Ostrinia nubilalis TaxID=29057 RepID=UPI00308225FF